MSVNCQNLTLIKILSVKRGVAAAGGNWRHFNVAFIFFCGRIFIVAVPLSVPFVGAFAFSLVSLLLDEYTRKIFQNV